MHMKSLATVPLTLCTAGHTFVSDIIFHQSAKHLAAIISDLATNLYCPSCITQG